MLGGNDRYALVAFVMLASVFCFTEQAKASIIEVSIPVGSSDATSHPLDDGVWSVTETGGTLPITTGIGYLVNPTIFSLGSATDFSLHDHGYVSPYIPDATRAIVTYQFDAPTIVSGVEIIQHTNGISQIEGFYGNSLGAMSSLGAVFGPDGDVTVGFLGFFGFTEGESQVFDFGNTTLAGTYFQFIVRKTPLSGGWASYRAIPLDAQGNRIAGASAVPEPGTMTLVGMGVFGLVAGAIRRHRSQKTAV